MDYIRFKEQLEKEPKENEFNHLMRDIRDQFLQGKVTIAEAEDLSRMARLQLEGRIACFQKKQFMQD